MCESHEHRPVDDEPQNQHQHQHHQKPRTRLLPSQTSSSATSATSSWSPGGPLFRAECAALLGMGVPLALASMLDRSSLWVTTAFIGRHGGAAELGPASLASTVNNVLGTSVNIGLSLAVQTLASQAAGAGDDDALRKALQRSFPVNLLFSLPVMALLLLLEPLLIALGRPRAFASAAAAYGACILPVAPLVGAQRAMTSWLAALKITRPPLLINLALVPLHALLTYVLVERTPLGYLGAGVAQSAVSLARAAATYCYIRISPRCAHGWPDGLRVREACSGWAAYLRLALPGVLFLAEFWVGELLVFAAALLPQPAAVLSAFAIYQLTNATCYQPPGGLRVAVGARVGNALGAATPAAARRAWVGGLLLVGAWLGVPALLLGTLTRPWASLFTDDEAVAALLFALVPWLVVYVSLDALLAINAGALTGCGRQGVGGRLALLSYVAIGLPAALLLAFGTPLGAVGIAMGHTLGKLIMTASTGWAVARTDWRAQSAAAVERIAGQAGRAAAAGLTDAPGAGGRGDRAQAIELKRAPLDGSGAGEEEEEEALRDEERGEEAERVSDQVPAWVAPAGTRG